MIIEYNLWNMPVGFLCSQWNYTLDVWDCLEVFTRIAFNWYVIVAEKGGLPSGAWLAVQWFDTHRRSERRLSLQGAKTTETIVNKNSRLMYSQKVKGRVVLIICFALVVINACAIELSVSGWSGGLLDLLVWPGGEGVVSRVVVRLMPDIGRW